MGGRAVRPGAAGPWSGRASAARFDEVRRSFVEAVHVAVAALAGPAATAVARLRDVRLRRLLRDEPELQAFIERELGPLLEVLRAYLETGCNRSLAAQVHHVSRPALYRRLESIQMLLDVDLDDWEQPASLYVALLAHEAQRAAGPEAARCGWTGRPVAVAGLRPRPWTARPRPVRPSLVAGPAG